MLMQKLQKKRKGFTLVELLIVMAIIGILVLVAVPKFTTSTETAKLRTLQANARTAASAVGAFMADNNGTQPTDIKALVDGKYLSSETYGAEGKTNTQPTTAQYVYANGKITATMTIKNGTKAPAGVKVDGTTATVEIDVAG